MEVNEKDVARIIVEIGQQLVKAKMSKRYANMACVDRQVRGTLLTVLAGMYTECLCIPCLKTVVTTG